MYCNECGKKLDENNLKYCPYCGEKLHINIVPQETKQSVIKENNVKVHKGVIIAAGTGVAVCAIGVGALLALRSSTHDIAEISSNVEANNSLGNENINTNCSEIEPTPVPTGYETEDATPEPDAAITSTPIIEPTPQVEIQYLKVGDPDTMEFDYYAESVLHREYNPNEVYSKVDLANLSNEDLRIVRNEIYARHGLIYSGDLGDIFNQTTWYHGTETDQVKMTKEVLTPAEVDNMNLIYTFEKNAEAKNAAKADLITFAYACCISEFKIEDGYLIVKADGWACRPNLDDPKDNRVFKFKVSSTCRWELGDVGEIWASSKTTYEEMKENIDWSRQTSIENNGEVNSPVCYQFWVKDNEVVKVCGISS